MGPFLQVIAELDEKKREALGKTWRKVNQDFGSIFSTLLPGTSAKLEPPEGATFLDGVILPPCSTLQILLLASSQPWGPVCLHARKCWLAEHLRWLA